MFLKCVRLLMLECCPHQWYTGCAATLDWTQCSFGFTLCVNKLMFVFMKLKYHESGKEKEVAPGVGQWNMIDKVSVVAIGTFFQLQ